MYTQNNIQWLLASTCSAASAVIMMFSFAVNSMIRGYHEYKSVWESPAADDDLLCEREVVNPNDTHAVAINKDIAGDIKTVGHIPRRISSISSIFIRRGGEIQCVVNGHRRYSADLPQGGLEIPCVLKFISKDEKELAKTEKLVEPALKTKSTGITEHSPHNFTSVIPAKNTSDSVLAYEATEKENINPNSFLNLTEDYDDEPPPAKKKKVEDYEKIIMGGELSDIEINYAQRLLKKQHPNFGGFHSTLLQGRVLVKDFANNIQIVYCSTRNHWITTTIVKCKLGEVKVFDSLFTYCDKETVKVIHDLYQQGSEKLTITQCRCQRQQGGKDCGLFSISFAVSLVFGMNPSRLKFCQDKMRAHLVECFTKQAMQPFPCK